MVRRSAFILLVLMTLSLLPGITSAQSATRHKQPTIQVTSSPT
ncbi:MAG TPA: hypothetical protein VFM10_07040 [Terriglobales bacterium]|jgi:hypothetical protein|nr:hypothetical protein [Terriglobales bacterium]